MSPFFVGRSAPFPNCDETTSQRAGSAWHDPLVQSLIYDLNRAVNIGIGHAKLMRNQLHQ
jgi:hypothetical protein